MVTNARSPGARCYGFVTMCSTEEATKCISHLHRTELHGRMISVERVSAPASETLSGLQTKVPPGLLLPYRTDVYKSHLLFQG